MVVPPIVVGFVFFIIAMLSLVFVYVTYRYWETPGARGLFLFATGVTLWSICLAIVKAVAGIPYTPSFVYAIILGMQFTTIGWLLFVAEFTGRWPLRRSVRASLVGYVILGQAFAWTDPIHNLLLGPETVVQDAFIFPDWQIGFWLLVGPAYMMVIVAVVLAGQEALESTKFRRIQALLLILGVIPPIFASITTVTEISMHDLTPIGFFFTLVLFIWGHRRAHLLEIVPIARRVVLDEIEDGVITVDSEQSVVDINESATRMLAVGRSVVGLSLSNALSNHPALLERIQSDSPDSETTIEVAGQEVHVDVSVSTVGTGAGPNPGRAIVIRDISTLKERERELHHRERQLEQQNERLERFAHVVSHDLRNPVNVAKGHIEIARETNQEESFDKVDDSLDRIEAIIDDVLSLAKQGKSIDEVEAVTVGSVAEEAWANVETHSATLSIEREGVIEADADRLLQLFENCIRNAVEHGGSTVTIWIGVEDGLLYVEDDGPGIPPAERESIFETGYSTGDDGIGLGLSIVHDIATGHGWDIAVTDGRDGGCRFEFHGVAVATESTV